MQPKAIFRKKKKKKNAAKLDKFVEIIRERVLVFSGGSAATEPTCNAGNTGDASLIPGLGRSPRGGNGNLLQDSCLKNLMDRGAWQVRVQRVAKSRTQLSH